MLFDRDRLRGPDRRATRRPLSHDDHDYDGRHEEPTKNPADRRHGRAHVQGRIPQRPAAPVKTTIAVERRGTSNTR